MRRSYAIIALLTYRASFRAQIDETESPSYFYFHSGKINAMSISLFFLILIWQTPMSPPVAALFLPDFGNCPRGIETMADFDMAQVRGKTHNMLYKG